MRLSYAGSTSVGSVGTVSVVSGVGAEVGVHENGEVPTTCFAVGGNSAGDVPGGMGAS